LEFLRLGVVVPAWQECGRHCLSGPHGMLDVR
jgi:hypothetical protein